MLKLFTLSQSAEWDSTVKSFSAYDVYYLSGYVKSFAVHGDGDPLLFYYESADLRAINVVMKRDIAKDERFAGKIAPNTYFDFVTPYGYGGWIIEGNGVKDKLFKEYEEWCKGHSIVSEFVRLHPILNNYTDISQAYNVVRLGNTVAMDLSTPTVIWDNITSKNRNMIRKAEKSGVEIGCGNSEELYNTFRDVYDKTMDRDNADKYYYFGKDFYSAIRTGLKDNSTVFYAKNADGKIIAASIILFCNNKLTYHLSGSKAEYRSLAPTNLLLYRAALWGCENGYRMFHLGGGVGSHEDNLFRFKRAFYKGDLMEFFIGKKIFDMDKYNKLLALRELQEATAFFPEYRG
ncbi:MAG: GNAT family N-acetyltransferase [Clostridiales bacterium]|nr:GNAT family N-acetyltransferase [Clostridiales bacterium]